MLLFELPFVLACLLPTAIVIVVNGFARANHRSTVISSQQNSIPPRLGGESASRRKHSFSWRMESRSRERGNAKARVVGAVIGMNEVVEGVRDGKKSSRNPGSAPLRLGNDVTKFRLGATEVNRYLLPSRRVRIRVCVRVCVYARPQPHLASIATIFPPLFFFVHVERKVRLRIQHAVAIRGVASRFVTLGKLKFPTLFLSLSPHLPSLSLPLPALFPSTSFPPLLPRSFRKTFRSHWDKSIFQLLKLIEYRF